VDIFKNEVVGRVAKMRIVHCLLVFINVIRECDSPSGGFQSHSHEPNASKKLGKGPTADPSYRLG